jgi:hypothetical protein
MNKILVGSQYFFSCYEDFSSKDIDEVEIIETDKFITRQLSGKGKCLFQLKKQASAKDYIDYAVKSRIAMVVGKFLVPEFAQVIGMEFEQLELLRPLIDRLDEKHKYEEIIYNSYLEN